MSICTYSVKKAAERHPTGMRKKESHRSSFFGVGSEALAKLAVSSLRKEGVTA